ncbi:MAG: hypothetical protein ACLFQA_00430 [Bacteroidales bacterium]
MITVGLPVYNQTKILPVALLGLTNQKNAGYWELIVSSEDEVWNIVDEFSGRLRQSGCINIVYDKLSKWTPLPHKWRRVGRLMNETSVGMMLQAADCYAHQDRIAKSRLAMNGGYDWYQERRGYFYDFKAKLLVMYDGKIKTGSRTDLNMCIATKHAKKLPLSDKRKGIDNWMLGTIDDPKMYISENIYQGVDIQGMNNISIKRPRKMRELAPPFKKTDKNIADIIEKWPEIEKYLQIKI